MGLCKVRKEWTLWTDIDGHGQEEGVRGMPRGGRRI